MSDPSKQPRWLLGETASIPLHRIDRLAVETEVIVVNEYDQQTVYTVVAYSINGGATVVAGPHTEPENAYADLRRLCRTTGTVTNSE